jgi:LysM domain
VAGLGRPYAARLIAAMSPQTPTTSARLLAPLALVACALAVFAILVASLAGGDSSNGDASPAETTEQTEASTQTTRERRPPATYTVQEGDTLGAIAEKTGVAVETIQLLNPEVDPQALIAGQKIKLRE